MGYGKLIDFTASIAHSFCSCYHFYFLLFHFISFHFSLCFCASLLVDAMITTSRRDFVFVPYRSQHRVASLLSCMLASKWVAFGC